MTPQEVLAEVLPELVDRRRLLRLGLTERTVDHLWRTVALIRVPGDSKTYATRAEVLRVLEEVVR